MLQLHTTFKSIAFILSSVFIISCSSHSKQDIEIMKALNESIDFSNKLIAESSKEELMSLNKKSTELGTIYKAKIWYPKAIKVDSLSNQMINQINNIKDSLEKNQSAAEEIILELINKMIIYKNELLKIDSIITKQFFNSIWLTTKNFDSSQEYKNLYINYFKQQSKINNRAMLNKLQNNILINQERMITFCNDQIGVADYWPVFHCILIFDSKLVRPKDSIELTTGMLSFQRYLPSGIFVNGKKMELEEDSFVHYKFKAASKPGRYLVPVKINYTDEEGRQRSFNMEGEYTVANIQKQ